MAALSLYTVVLALLGVVPGETTGWGTGDVEFVGYVRTSEHQEIYPVCAGQYTVEVSVRGVLEDRGGLLEYITSVEVCYDDRLNLVPGDLVEVTGTYHDGACPLAFCGRVEASSVYRISSWEEEEDEEDPCDIESPYVTTDSAEAMETTATLRATLVDDGGESCRCRFFYKQIDGRWWNTEWTSYVTSGTTLSQKIVGLAPNTRYIYYIEAQNSAGWGSGRQGAFVTLPETVPPIPHPAAWLTEPTQLGTTSVTMMADAERDLAGPLEYVFDFVSSPTGGAGGSDSLWQFSPLYLDVGLNANHQYGYRVKARDGHGNETAFSPIRYAYTDIETPAGVTFGEITINSIQVKSSSTLSGLTRGKSGLRLENVTTGHVSAWQQDNAFWTSSGLLPNTQYAFWAQARNGYGDLTPVGGEGSAYTLAMVPTAVVFSAVTTNQVFVHWGANGNPAGTQYWCQNTVTNANSGWITSTQWLDTGLSPNARYSYRVKARNGDGVETAFSATVNSYSAIETPTGITFGTITSNSIQARSANTPSGLNQGESGLWLENVTTGQTSSWRRDNSFWTSDGLLPNCRYGFRARARNGDGVQSPSSEITYAHTQANVPVRVAFTGVAITSINVQWGTNGNPPGTLYLCENTTAHTNSGWTPGTTWDNTGLTPNTSYAYRVKARNADGVETAWADLGAQSTEYRSLTIDSTPGGKVTSPGQDVFRYAPGATVNLAATPLGGYHFLSWTGSAVDAGRVADPSAAQTTVLVDAHYTLTANFLRTRIHVDARATGTKDGSTWKNACTSLQDALSVAQTGNEICVAQGTYRPDTGRNVVVGDRFATFELKSGVAIKGGYAGLTNSDPNTRNIGFHKTILSGDLSGDDKAISGSHDLYAETRRTDNSFHVVTALSADGATLLEGVTITAGNGIDGAGICLIRSDPVVSQCTIRTNRAGQLSADGLEGWGEGAGVSCYQSKPVFLDCLFLNNWTGGQGGGLYSVESSPILMGCLFYDNQAGMQGGGMYCQDSNSVWVDCTFHANWSWDGGAIYNDEGGNSRMTSCRFLGNAGHGLGGAVFDAGRSLDVTNCVFSGNLADVDGGAMALVRSPAVLTNCTFNRNIAEGKQAGQALAVHETKVSLANCVLWDHEDSAPAQIALTGTADNPAGLIVAHCDVPAGATGVVRKGNTTVTWGGGNIDADPRFQNPAGADHVAGTEDDDLHVRTGSPCIDAGNNTAVPADIDDLDVNGNRLERIPFDLDNKPRFVDRSDTADKGVPDAPLYPKIVDMGAYELGNPLTP